MNIDKAITASMLGKELGVSAGTANALLREIGEGERLGNMMLFDRDDARRVVAKKYENILKFLGCVVSLNGELDA